MSRHDELFEEEDYDPDPDPDPSGYEADHAADVWEDRLKSDW